MLKQSDFQNLRTRIWPTHGKRLQISQGLAWKNVWAKKGHLMHEKYFNAVLIWEFIGLIGLVNKGLRILFFRKLGQIIKSAGNVCGIHGKVKKESLRSTQFPIPHCSVCKTHTTPLPNQCLVSNKLFPNRLLIQGEPGARTRSGSLKRR